jgi:hypothetical protein
LLAWFGLLLDFSGGFAQVVTDPARAGWRRDRTLSRVRFLRTTPFMRPRVALDTTSVAYVLCRIEDDASLTPVSAHEDILTAIAAGGYAVEVEDLEFAYALYAGDPSNGSATRVASFREGRIGYRLWAMRSGRINPSLEDRLDHDVDELLA